jgi:hypothetical protein
MSAPHTASVHVGKPPRKYDMQEWARTSLHFHGFAGLPKERGAPVASSRFTCVGHRWQLILYAGGAHDAKQRMVSVELIHVSDKDIQITLKISFRYSIIEDDFKFIADRHRKFNDFAKRATIMKSLVDGTLVIGVAMKLADQKLADPTKVKPPPFIPENPSACKLIQSWFMDEESSDVVFEVGGQRGKDNAEKVARTAPVAFHAHRLILSKCSSVLADMCGPVGEGEGMIPIQIDNVSPEIFRLLLNYIYGGSVSDNDMRERAKEIIDAADTFQVTNLKLAAEAHFVQATSFRLENMIEHLIYAESKNCALLKEAVMDFIWENKNEVLNTKPNPNPFNGVIAPEIMIIDVLAAVERGEKKGGSISELRRKAHKKGLDVDGSRERLIAALAGSP